jgi:hypothetical protein
MSNRMRFRSRNDWSAERVRVGLDRERLQKQPQRRNKRRRRARHNARAKSSAASATRPVHGLGTLHHNLGRRLVLGG